MAEPLQLARAHQRHQVALKHKTMRAMARAWRDVDPAAIQDSWRAALPVVLATVTAAQRQAAEQANPYVAGILAAQGVTSAPAGVVVPDSLAGVASDGRSLLGLFAQPAAITQAYLRQGQPAQRAMSAGQLSLLRMTATQVADAGRVAEKAQLAMWPGTGYVRLLDPPSCKRCVVLAGKWFRYNEGFDRHPLCDCIHIPVAEARAEDLRLNPNTYFDSLSRAEQDRIFGPEDAETIRLGGDIGQVVNAHRGMDTAQLHGHDVKFTREGVTRYGLYGQSEAGKAGRVRIMPETILQIAHDRDDAIRLLKRYGYIRAETPGDREHPVELAAPGAEAPPAGGGGQDGGAGVGGGAQPPRPPIPSSGEPDPPIGPVLGTPAQQRYSRPGNPPPADDQPQADANHFFTYIPDPADRAVALLTYDNWAERLVKAAALSQQTGQPLGRSWEDDIAGYYAFMLQRPFGATPDSYTVDDLKLDVTSAAQRLLSWPSRKLPVAHYKGLGLAASYDVTTAQGRAAALADLSTRGLAFTSATPSVDVAAAYSSLTGQTEVLLEFPDTEGVRLRMVGRMSMSPESLISGDFEIVRSRPWRYSDGQENHVVLLVELRRAA